jgi:hypothetical protein
LFFIIHPKPTRDLEALSIGLTVQCGRGGEQAVVLRLGGGVECELGRLMVTSVMGRSACWANAREAELQMVLTGQANGMNEGGVLLGLKID